MSVGNGCQLSRARHLQPQLLRHYNDSKRRFEKTSSFQDQKLHEEIMLTLEPGLRTLLLTRIRGLNDEQLKAYEGLVALQLELQQRLRANPENRKVQEQNEFNALYDLWLARRRKALSQGNYFQVPRNWKALVRYCSSWWHYRKSQLKTVRMSRQRDKG